MIKFPAKLTVNAITLIDGKNSAFPATIMPDGSPHVSPVPIDREGDTTLVNAALGRGPRVAISIPDNANPYEMVVIRGRVTAQTAQNAGEHTDKLAKKYIGKDKYPWHRPEEKRIRIKKEAERISA